MIFRDAAIDRSNQPYFLGQYHPYNRRCQGYGAFPDSDILDLKKIRDENSLVNGYPHLVNWYATKLEPLLAKGFAIAVVPPGDPSQDISGIREVGRRLACEGRVDATRLLVRHRKINKLSTGGNRAIEVHLRSVRVDQPALIKGREVLLMDDVFTTGNSMRACWLLLMKAGARRVRCLALGRTVQDQHVSKTEAQSW